MILSRHHYLIILIAALGLSTMLILGWHTRANLLKSCDGGTVNRQQCFAEHIEQILSTKGLDAAFDTLLTFSQQDVSFASACHGNAHELGKVAYRDFVSGTPITSTRKMSYCGYGFFHGFVETMFAERGDVAEVVSFCRSFDNQTGGVTGGANACFHGIGHGVVDGTDPRSFSNPSAMIRPGMELCARLPDEPVVQYVCRAGAYNSLEILSTDAKYNLKSLADDPYAFCHSEPRTRQDACYVNMIPAVLRITKNDVVEATRYLLPRITHPDDFTVDGFHVDELVVLGLFHEFVRLNSGDQEKILKGVELCRDLPSDRLHLACIQGLSGGYMKYDTPESAYENWRVFCGSTSLREDERQACFKYVLKRIRLWYDENHATKICNDVPPAYQDFCRIREKTKSL